MMPLQMTDSEIIRRYDGGKGTSIQILAELNATYPERIKEILGIPVDKPLRKFIDDEIATQLYQSGKNDTEMAAELKVAISSVGAWRKKRGLKSNNDYSKNAKKWHKERMVDKLKNNDSDPTEYFEEPTPHEPALTEKEMFFEDVTPVPGKIQMTPNSVDLIDSAKRTSEVGCSRLTPNIYDVISTIVSGRTEPIPCVTLEPRDSWESRRTEAVRSAIMRHVEIRAQIPAEWVLEYNERVGV